MAGGKKATRGRPDAAEKNTLSHREAFIKTSRMPAEYYLARIQIKGQQATIKTMQLDLANQAQVLYDNSELIDTSETTTRRCSELQTTLSATQVELGNAQETLKLTQNVLQQLQVRAEQQEAQLSALDAENAELRLRVQQAEQRVNKTSPSPLINIAASLAAVSSSGDSVFGVMMWLLMAFVCSSVIPITLMLVSAVVAAAATAVCSCQQCLAYSSSVLPSWVGATILTTAKGIWASVSCGVVSYSAAIIPDSVAFALQLRALLISKLCALDSAVCAFLDSVLVACYDDDASSSAVVTEESAATYNRLVGSWGSSSDSSTTTSRQVSRSGSFEERGVASSDEGSSSSSSDFVVEVHLVNACMKVGSVVGNVCSDALHDDVTFM